MMFKKPITLKEWRQHCTERRHFPHAREAFEASVLEKPRRFW